ncbi:serine/threonine-protein kinase [Halostreptopolyspora alba]|uniref:non-specific serine/threonine protein kinase n=1 Tax=Halostreptopolyspora alba TaxID=2487137 RepID=A0A3N0E8R8_9ACTN|nr:serine/threonine protein kinase [Nocardiopsaceae bacterium YIM 96095]
MFQQRVIADRYELTTPIGQGGMGVVLRGYDRRLDRRIAVKLMSRKHLSASDTQADVLVERFLRETRMTSRVEHPGVPAVYDAGTENGDLYLVMQLVEGQNLGDFLAQRGPLPVESAAAIGAQLASVLTAAHSGFLVHRDIKPPNVMVGPDGAVKLLDFGIAILLDPNIPRLTRSHEALGSAPYIAPELCTGADATARTDLYALGCLIFEILTGRPPFTGSLPEALLYQHVNTSPPALGELRDDAPAPLAALLTDLLSKEPTDRPAHADEVLTRLAPFLPAPRPVGTPDTSGEHDPTRPFRYPFASRSRTGGDTARADTPAFPAPYPTGPIDPDQVYDEVDRLVDNQRFVQAGDVLSDVLANAEELPEDVCLRFMRMRADAWLYARRIDQAEREYRRLLPLLIEHHGEGASEVIACRDALAACLVELDRYAEAVEVLLDLLDNYRALGEEETQDALEVRFELARGYAALGELDNARNRLRDLHDDAVRVLGPDHPLTRKVQRLLH